MQNNQVLTKDLHQGLTLTAVKNIPLKAGDIGKAISVAGGACKAVILQLNKYALNTTDVLKTEYFYFGDALSQNFEVIRGFPSQLIFCENLSQVFLRYPDLVNSVGWEENIIIQVLVYT